MIRSSVSPQQVVKMLNRAFAADPTCMSLLTATRHPCNIALADDPEIQALALTPAGQEKKDMKFTVGILGFLNGLFGVNSKGAGCIQAVYDVHPETMTTKLKGFVYHAGEETIKMGATEGKICM